MYELLRTFERGERIAKWWEAVSRIVKKYILPYVSSRELDKERLELLNLQVTSKLKFTLEEAVRNILYPFHVLAYLDVFLQAADSVYRSFEGGLGDLVLVECEHMQRIYKCDDMYGT